MDSERYSHLVLSWVLIVQSAAILIMGIITLGRLSPAPADVLRRLEQLEDNIIVAAPDRWTGTDQELWERELFRMNPDLQRPKARQ
jgi:hypothetical protein